MAAEVVKHFFPKMVELHNYSPANSTQQKMSNWSILNRQGMGDLRRLSFVLQVFSGAGDHSHSFWSVGRLFKGDFNYN